MNGGQTAQKLLATCGDPRMHLTSIGFTGLSFDITPITQSIDEFDRRMVPEPHPLRQNPNCWLQFRRKPLNGKQQLVLLAVQAIFLRSLFAECEKVSDLIAEFCESLIFLRIHPNDYISHCDIYRFQFCRQAAILIVPILPALRANGNMGMP